MLEHENTEEPLPEPLPIIPLESYVLFPGSTAPILVGEDKSRVLVEELLKRADRRVGVLMRKPDGTSLGDFGSLHSVGTVGLILRMIRTPDGAMRVLLHGLGRFEVDGVATEEPYLQAHASWINDEVEQGPEVEALVLKVRELVNRAVDLSSLSEDLKIVAANMEDPRRLPDFVAANLNLRVEQQQAILEQRGVRARLETILRIVGHEVHIMEIGDRIQSEVRTTLDKNQREYVLREKMRAIRRELGEEEGTSDTDLLRKRMEEKNLPVHARQVVEREISRLENLPTASPEHGLTRTYIESILDLPWSERTTDRLDLKNARELLEKGHEGLQPVKDRILEFLAVRQLNSAIRGQILCFVGPPGTGKTSLGRAIAETLGRKFQRISLGGMHDEADIRGHRRTYVGAMPGRILKAMKAAGTLNPVILLDEIDKVGSSWRGDPSAALLETLDPEQNATFTDHYLDMPYDLSEVLFLTTANDLDMISDPLRDRMEIIEVPGYTLREKVAIAKRHLVPRQRKEHGLKVNQLKFQDKALMTVIENYTREAGVRGLDRQIAGLCRKVGRKIVEHEAAPSVITSEVVKELLGPEKFLMEEAHRGQVPGVVMGLAWTPVGGEVLTIEATRTPGKGDLILTGQLGDVMKESVQAAQTWLRSVAPDFGLDIKVLQEFDIHVHVPAGAVPKDGPSAGIAMATSLTSLLKDQAVRPMIAMSGEITLKGTVLPVGGIREKVLAAHRAGIREVILPERNKRDFEQLPEEVRKAIKVHFVTTADEAVRVALQAPKQEPRSKPSSKKTAKPAKKAPSRKPTKR